MGALDLPSMGDSMVEVSSSAEGDFFDFDPNQAEFGQHQVIMT